MKILTMLAILGLCTAGSLSLTACKGRPQPAAAPATAPSDDAGSGSKGESCGGEGKSCGGGKSCG